MNVLRPNEGARSSIDGSSSPAQGGAGRAGARALGLVLLLLMTGGCESLRSLFGQELTPAEKSAKALFQADALLEAGDHAGAQAAYREALNNDPTSARATFGLAQIYQSRGEDTRAILELKQTQELVPTDPVPRALIGEILLRQGRTEQAVESFAKAVALAPGDSRMRFQYAWALLRDARVSEAEDEIDRLLRSDPSNPSVRSLRGLAFAARGKTREARRMLEEAAESAESALPEQHLGLFRMQQGDAAGAVAAFRTALSRHQDASTARLLADALIESGQGSEAAEVLEPFVRSRPRDPLVQASFARALVARGEYPQALEAARKASRQDPQLAAARLAEGEALEAMDDVDGAIRSYRVAAKVAPGHADVYRRLAAACRRQNQVADAIDALERLVTLEPGDRRAQVSLAHLYATSPINAEKGLRIVERLLDEEPGDIQLSRLRRDLKALAKTAPKKARPKGPSGPVIIRGAR